MDPGELTRRIHKATPFIGLLGVEILTAGNGKAVLRLPLRDELTQDLGYAHGGVVGAFADIAANTAWNLPSLTVEYKVNFLRGARGEQLFARAELLKRGRTLSVAEARVYGQNESGEEVLASIATVTLAPIKHPPSY